MSQQFLWITKTSSWRTKFRQKFRKSFVPVCFRNLRFGSSPPHYIWWVFIKVWFLLRSSATSFIKKIVKPYFGVSSAFPVQNFSEQICQCHKLNRSTIVANLQLWNFSDNELSPRGLDHGSRYVQITGSEVVTSGWLFSTLVTSAWCSARFLGTSPWCLSVTSSPSVAASRR